MRKVFFLSLILIIFSNISSAHYFSESYSNWNIVNNKISAANYANGYYASAGAYFINDPKAWPMLD